MRCSLIAASLGLALVAGSATAAVPADVSPASRKPPARHSLVGFDAYGLGLRRHVWDIPLTLGGVGLSLRFRVTPELSIEVDHEAMYGKSPAGLSWQEYRQLLGVDQRWGLLHVRPAIQFGVLGLERVTTTKTMIQVGTGASLRVGPAFELDEHNALAVDLLGEFATTPSYSYGIALRYVHF